MEADDGGVTLCEALRQRSRPELAADCCTKRYIVKVSDPSTSIDDRYFKFTTQGDQSLRKAHGLRR